jgi:hypothetical protein
MRSCSREENVEEYECTECGGDVSLDHRYCPSCGVSLEDGVSAVTVPLRYPALRTIAGFYRILAIAVFLAALVGIVYAISYWKEREGQFIILYLSSAFGLFGTVTTLAVAETIKVFIDIEENTRKTVELQRRR